MKTTPSLLLGFAAILGILSFSISASAAATPKSVVVNGKTYYVIDGNNPSLNSANRVCAAVGKKFVALVANNTVCTALHPTASVSTIMDGAPYGFYCNGAPQTDRACSTRRNSCAICTACNKANVNADSQIGTWFAEMYVDCGQSSSSTYGVPPIPLRRPFFSSSSKSSSRSSVLLVPVLPIVDGKTCSWTQGSAGGGIHATCNVNGAAGNFCIGAMGLGAVATGCTSTRVTCTMRCSTPGIQNFVRCPFGATTTAPTGACTSSSSSRPAVTAGSVQPGGLCKTGADCSQNPNLTYCVGFSPNTRCSCSMFSQTTAGCVKNLNGNKNQPSGAPCTNGGQCKSGMCLGSSCK